MKNLIFNLLKFKTKNMEAQTQAQTAAVMDAKSFETAKITLEEILTNIKIIEIFIKAGKETLDTITEKKNSIKSMQQMIAIFKDFASAKLNPDPELMEMIKKGEKLDYNAISKEIIEVEEKANRDIALMESLIEKIKTYIGQ